MMTRSKAAVEKCERDPVIWRMIPPMPCSAHRRCSLFTVHPSKRRDPC